MSGMHLSKEFFELLKAIGESKSKQEEDRIIAREVAVLKKKLEGTKKSGPAGSPGPQKQNQLATNKKKAKEFLVRLLYVEMLGHDGSFGYIKAVELAASSSIIHKRTGYLVCAACLSPEHEFRFMVSKLRLASTSSVQFGNASKCPPYHRCLWFITHAHFVHHPCLLCLRQHNSSSTKCSETWPRRMFWRYVPLSLL